MRERESELQMVQRHVREGEATVARQRALILRLSERFLPTGSAIAVLATLEHAQALHAAHLERLQS
ncbi:MAG: hypothetical protein E5W74_09175 [Mesorhizobium sp.]|nr:MAG: hypothetical protein E5W74_09175 [Mesorhizobium sp.]